MELDLDLDQLQNEKSNNHEIFGPSDLPDDFPKKIDLKDLWDLPEILELKNLKKQNKHLKEKLSFIQSIASRAFRNELYAEKKIKRLTEENLEMKKRLLDIRKNKKCSDSSTSTSHKS